MYLKSLKVFNKDGALIRNVKFKMGINLIIGLNFSNQDQKELPTNSIGKTTLLRSIDFCLGGKVDQFFQDSEFKEMKNQQIFDFFVSHTPVFELTVAKSLVSTGFQSVITRQIRAEHDPKKGVKLTVENKIDGNIIPDDSFSPVLKELLFKSTEEKPSFRELIQKFIRKEDNQVSKILNYFHSATSKNKIEIVQLFLFGFSDVNTLNSRKMLTDSLKKEEKYKIAFNTKTSKGLDQVVRQQGLDLDHLIQARDNFKISERYDSDNKMLSQLQTELNALDSAIAEQKSNILSLMSREEGLVKNKFIDSTESIRLVYEEAKILNISIQKSFEDTVHFHNSMMDNEVLYLKDRIQREEKVLRELEDARQVTAQDYSELLRKLGELGSLAEYTILNEKINKLTSEISRNRAYISQLEESNKRISDIKEKIQEINILLEKQQQKLKDNIAVFNEYFSDYCYKIFEERYILIVDFNENAEASFLVRQYQSNAGSGKQQSVVTAFDLAYTSFINDSRVNLPFPSFATQDKIEIIDSSTIQILSKLANESSGQLIFPLIADKFLSLNDLKDDVVLELSSNNRFFGL